MAVFKLSEKDWQSRVIDAAKLFGWRYAHFRPARTAQGWRTAMSGHPGFPDLVLTKGLRIIFAELKAEDGNLTEDQFVWLNRLGESGRVEVFVWRPSDWEEVYKTLART